MTEETKKVIDKLTELAEMVTSKPMYGIRSKKNGKLILIGTLDKTVLYTNESFTYNLWYDKHDAETVYNIMSQNDDFKNNCFIDKATEEELELYYTVQMHGVSMKGETDETEQ